jgi:hypothetical protein
VEFVQRSDDPGWFVQRLRSHLDVVGVGHDAEHALELAARLARAGHAGLGPAVRAAFARLNDASDPELGHEALLLLDGPEALRPIAGRAGQRLLDDPDDWVDESFFSCLDDHLGKDEVRMRLDELAGSDRRVAELLRRVQETTEYRSRSNPEPIVPPTPAELERVVRLPRHAPGYGIGFSLAEEQVRDLLARLERADQSPLVPRILQVLDWRARTAGHRGLRMTLTDGVRALARQAGAATRGQAIELLALAADPAAVVVAREVLLHFAPGDPSEALKALGARCELADVPAVMRALDVLARLALPPNELQRAVGGALSLAESPAGAELAEVMRWVYEHSLCGHCREESVKLLVTWGALDDARRAECRDDAFADVRAAAGW